MNLETTQARQRIPSQPQLHGEVLTQNTNHEQQQNLYRLTT